MRWPCIAGNDRGEIYDEAFAGISPSRERRPMRCGLDTNVLVYAHLPVFPESGTVQANLRTGLADDTWQFVLTPGVLHEFVHVITDSRRFDPPVAMVGALALARGYLDRTNVGCLSIDARVLHLAFELLDTHTLCRKRIADILLAATLLRHGVNSIMTCNPGDFAMFDELAAIDPREASKP